VSPFKTRGGKTGTPTARFLSTQRREGPFSQASIPIRTTFDTKSLPYTPRSTATWHQCVRTSRSFFPLS